MGNEDRQKMINELKALRVELMAYKEFFEGEDGQENVENMTLASLRKSYSVENVKILVEAGEYDDVRKEVYNQYDQCKTKEQNFAQEKHLSLIRRK